jgi:peroxiredoxin
MVGISAQDVASHHRFVEKNSLTVPLLADMDGTVTTLALVRPAFDIPPGMC